MSTTEKGFKDKDSENVDTNLHKVRMIGELTFFNKIKILISSCTSKKMALRAKFGRWTFYKDC